MEGSKRSMERQEAESMNSEQKQRISRNHNSTSKISLGRSRRNQGTCHIWMESCGCLVSKSFGIAAIQGLRKELCRKQWPEVSLLETGQNLLKLSTEFVSVFLHQNPSQACQMIDEELNDDMGSCLEEEESKKSPRRSRK